MTVNFGGELLAAALAGVEGGEDPLRHVADLPASAGRPSAWPDWADPDVISAFAGRGIETPWSHQRAAADLAHAGRHVVIGTGS